MQTSFPCIAASSWGGCWKTQAHSNVQSKPTPKGSNLPLCNIRSQRMSWCDCFAQSHGVTPALCMWDPASRKHALSSFGFGFGHSESRHFRSCQSQGGTPRTRSSPHGQRCATKFPIWCCIKGRCHFQHPSKINTVPSEGRPQLAGVQQAPKRDWPGESLPNYHVSREETDRTSLRISWMESSLQ